MQAPRLLVRLATTLIAGALILAVLSTAPTQAATPASSSVSTTTHKELTPTSVTRELPASYRKVNADAHWWGWGVTFTRTETRSIAAGTGSCAVVVSKLPSLPAKIISGACGLMTVYAGYLLSGSRCLYVSFLWTGWPYIGSRSC